jgi:uncharacterized protein YecE (DUF72 family)
MSSYNQKDMEYWAGFIKECAQTLKTVYAYFNNTASMFAIGNAKTLRELLGPSAR